MRIFITGSTGFIGAQLTTKLAESGNSIHALYRSEERKKVLNHPNIHLFNGDILDKNSLQNAMQHCDYVFHMAGFTNVWAKNKNSIQELNVTGTKNVLDTAINVGVKKVIFTSTAGILGPSIHEKVDENSQRKVDYFIDYERTKAEAEELIKSYLSKNIEITIVNPTRVYGPGILSKSNSVTMLIQQFDAGKWRIIPGDGKSIGNYVFIDDVVNGHILALQKGKSGERYVLGGTDLSYLDFFSTLRKITGNTQTMVKIPMFLMLPMAHSMLFMAKNFNIPPIITPSLLKKYNHNWEVSSEKAIHELGYSITPFDTGVQQTLQWLKKTAYENSNV